MLEARATVLLRALRRAVDSRAGASVRRPRGRQHRRAHAGSHFRTTTRAPRSRRPRISSQRRTRSARTSSWNRFGVASSVSNSRRLRHQGSSGARRRVGRAQLARREQGAVQARLDGQPRGRDDSAVHRHDERLRDRVPASRRTASRRPTASRPSPLVGSKDAGWNVAYASSSLTGGSTDATGSDELAPAEAWTEAANNVGVDASVVDIAAQSTKAGATTLAVHGLSQTQHVKKAVFATPHHGARAAYDATVTTNAGGNLESYQVVVDAQTGDLLYRQSQVDYISDNPTWLAPRHSMPYNDLNAFPWNYPTTDNRALFCWTATAGCDVGRGRQPGDDGLPDRRRLEVPVGRPAQRRRAPTSARRRRSATTSTTRGCGAGATASTATRRSSARRARPATTSRRSRTPGTRRAATRTTSTPRSTRSATTSRPRRFLCSSATTSCTTGRTTSASTRGTGTRSSTTTASRRTTRRRRRAARRSRPARATTG